MYWGGHSGRKSQFLAPQDIPDISGYQLGIGCQFVKEHIDENPGPDQKIFQIRFVSNFDICKIVNECPGQYHVKAKACSFETWEKKQKLKPNELYSDIRSSTL